MFSPESIANKLIDLSWISRQDLDAWFPVCKHVYEQVLCELRDGVDPDTQEWRLCYYAAALTLRLRAGDSMADKGISSFKAGDLTVAFDADAHISCADTMLEEAAGLCADILKDGQFLFSEVRS